MQTSSRGAEVGWWGSRSSSVRSLPMPWVSKPAPRARRCSGAMIGPGEWKEGTGHGGPPTRQRRASRSSWPAKAGMGLKPGRSGEAKSLTLCGLPASRQDLAAARSSGWEGNDFPISPDGPVGAFARPYSGWTIEPVWDRSDRATRKLPSSDRSARAGKETKSCSSQSHSRHGRLYQPASGSPRRVLGPCRDAHCGDLR